MSDLLKYYPLFCFRFTFEFAISPSFAEFNVPLSPAQLMMDVRPLD